MRDALADKETQLTKVSADRKAAERLAQANATALGVASVDTAAKLRSFRDALHVSEAAVAMLHSTNTALEQRAKEAEAKLQNVSNHAKSAKELARVRMQMEA